LAALVALLLMYPAKRDIVGGREIRSYHTMTELSRAGVFKPVVVVSLDKGPLWSVGDGGVLVFRPRRLLGVLAFPLAPFIVVLVALSYGFGTIVYVPHPPPIGVRMLDGLAMVVLSLASRLGLIRLWVNIHDPFIIQRLYTRGSKGPTRGDKLVELLEPTLFAGARYATGASRSIALMYEPLHGGRIGVYYAGVDPTMVPVARSGGRDCIVGYTGSPGDDDLDLAVEAVGRVGGRLRIYTLKAKSVPMEGPVEVVEGVKYSDFPRVAREVDVFILPRRPNPLSKTTMPNKYPLYLASGRPVAASATPEIMLYTMIASKWCGWPAHLRIARGGLSEALEEACRLPDNPEYGECMAVNLSWRENLRRAMEEAGIPARWS